MSGTPLIPETDLSISFVRSAGPGGQNVNKVATAAQLRFDLAGTTALDERTKARLRALAGHRLWLRFEDGVEGEVVLTSLVPFEGVFEPLRDQARFAEVRVNLEIGTVCWPNGADLDPAVLYSHVTGRPLPGTEQRAAS